MVANKFVVALSLFCLASYCYAQTTNFGEELPAAAQSGFNSGSYLVNGTGVVYDADSITFYLNGTAVGTVPNPKAGAPGPASPFDPNMLKDLPPHPGKDMKDMPPSTAPGASAVPQDDIFGTILGQLKDQPNPLDNIIIG